MNLQERIKNRSEISKLIKEIYFKFKNIFKDLTNSEAKQITNAIGNITGFVIRKSGYNLGDISVPLLINGVDNFNLNETASQEVKYYPSSEVLPFTVTCSKNFNPTLGPGQYISIQSQVDNQNSITRLFKNISAGTLIGVYNNNNMYFQAAKEDFGSDLQLGTPFNIEVENNTSLSPSFIIFAQCYTEFLSSVTGSTITTQQWQTWDYLYPFWSIDMTNETQGIKFELYHKETNQLLGNGYAYPGNNYPGDGYMGKVDPIYSTNNFKIVISNI